MHSNIRNVPPTADVFMNRAQLTDPEKVRTYDEAVVLVGNEKTLKGSEQLWHVVKKINPKCLKDMPSIYNWRHGLNKALRTTNPYLPAQVLFPAKPVKGSLDRPDEWRAVQPHQVPGTVLPADCGVRRSLDVQPSESELPGDELSQEKPARHGRERCRGARRRAFESS